MTDIGPRELNRATLQRQLLLERHDLSISETIEGIGAVQAQEPAAPYVALWNRISGLDLDTVDQAFAEQTIVKAPLMRVTLHAVNAGDYSAFHTACEPILRASRLNDRRFLESGLTMADADGVIDGLLDLTQTTRSKPEIEAHLAGLDSRYSDPILWWAVRTFAPILHAPSGPPWSFVHKPIYRAAPADEHRPALKAALDFLVRRYLTGFGPASVADIAQFTLQKRTVVRAAIERLSDELTTLVNAAGTELVDILDGVNIPSADTPAPPRLMAMWDSTLLAYQDRSRIIPDEYRAHIIRRNGDTLPTILVDGYVAGVWRIIDGEVEITAFHQLDTGTWDGLRHEASSLLEVVADRKPPPFKRYHRWWSQLPVAEQHTAPAGK